MVNISKFGEDFLLLALRIDKHIKGYVDFYYGPENLRHIVELEVKSSPSKLLIDSNNLLNKLDLQGYDITRERYLEKMLTAMKTSIELLNDIEHSIEDQFLNIYDVVLHPVKNSEMRNLREEYEKAYEGPGSLEKRLNHLRGTRRVHEANVFTLFEKAIKIVRKQTNFLFPNLLPEEENISIDLVEKTNDEVKWAFYNWYLGNYHSRIEVNPKYTMHWTTFLFNASHEGYPGHHTEFVLNEKRQVRELNHFEHSILILHSPKMIISEGIANLANSMLFSNKESAEISLRELSPNVSEEESLEKLILQDKLRTKTSLFWYNFAYHSIVDKYSEEELIQYGKSIEFFNEEVLKVEIKRLSNPAYSKNAFLYYLGTKILKKKYGEKPSIKEFQNLLLNPTLPSDLI